MKKSSDRQAKVDALMASAAKRIIDIIASGEALKWEKEWHGNPLGGMPYNPVSGHVFTGFNRFLLMLDMLDRGTGDPRYLTFQQVAALGEQHNVECHVRKGEKASYLLKPVVFNKKSETEGDSGDEDQEGCSRANIKKAVFFQSYPVFHASQIENMPALPKPNKPDWENDDFIEDLMEKSRVDLRHGGDRAFFSPSGDFIQMPEPESFKSGAAYYATLLHEWYHWTGHSSRENRVFGAAFGDEHYSLEEIRAESLSVLAGMALGLPLWVENHAAYLQSWTKKLESTDGVKEIIKGINEASRMLDVILAVRDGIEPEIDWWPDEAQEIESTPVLA